MNLLVMISTPFPIHRMPPLGQRTVPKRHFPLLPESTLGGCPQLTATAISGKMSLTSVVSPSLVQYQLKQSIF